MFINRSKNLKPINFQIITNVREKQRNWGWKKYQCNVLDVRRWKMSSSQQLVKHGGHGFLKKWSMRKQIRDYFYEGLSYAGVVPSLHENLHNCKVIRALMITKIVCNVFRSSNQQFVLFQTYSWDGIFLLGVPMVSCFVCFPRQRLSKRHHYCG